MNDKSETTIGFLLELIITVSKWECSTKEESGENCFGSLDPRKYCNSCLANYILKRLDSHVQEMSLVFYDWFNPEKRDIIPFYGFNLHGGTTLNVDLELEDHICREIDFANEHKIYPMFYMIKQDKKSK